MSNKPKYSIGETVRIKATGEKVYIDSRHNFEYGAINVSGRWGAYNESELKPYRPSRSGKYRDVFGRFCKKDDYFIDNPDSKQRNYQKILGELICIRAKQDEIEKKIDELGRRV